MTKILIGNVYCQVVDLDNRSARIHLDNVLSFYVQGYQFTKAFRNGWWDNKKQKWQKWDGKKHLLLTNLRFLKGLLPKVETVLKNNGVEYEIVDKRKAVKFKRKIKTKNIETRPYQQRALEASLKEKGGIIKSATGSGKSVMITQLIASTNVKTMVYVIGIDLLYQMKETFEKMLGTKVGVIGDGVADIRKINVCTVWTAANVLGKKYVPLDDEDRSKKEKLKAANKAKIIKAIKESEMAIFDECHMLATDTLQAINNASVAAYYKYGYSGTPWRDDGADLLIEAVCGKTIIEVTATELIKSGYLVEPTIHFLDVPAMNKLPEKYPSIYKEYIVDNEVRNGKIIKAATKLVESGRKVLILVKTLRHGKILLEELEQDYVVYFVKGDIDSDERTWIRQEFIKSGIDIIIASVVYDQGVDLPNLDALVLAGSGKSSGRALQRLGRVIRPFPGKKNAIVVDFIDNAKYLLNHTAARTEIYRTEAGFKIKLPKKKGYNDGSKETKKAKGKRLPPKDIAGEKCPGKYKLTYEDNAPIYTCDKCGDQDLTWKKFYTEYLGLFRQKENWDSKKDQVSCIIGFFCHMYEEFYGTAYVFVPRNPNPYGAKECRDTWSLLAAFNGDAHEVRKYLYWVFKRGINKNTTMTHFGYVNTPGLIRKYNIYAKRKHILRRESKLPKPFIDWCKEYAVQIFDNYELGTMNDLGALLNYARHYDVSGVEGTVLERARELHLIKDDKLNIG